MNRIASWLRTKAYGFIYDNSCVLYGESHCVSVKLFAMTTATMSATATLKPSTELTLQQIVSRNMRMALGYYNTDQKTLAKALGQASSSISLKMRGKLTWSLEDIEKASGFFNVKPEALVAGHGFEHGPLGYEPSELPSCSTPRRLVSQTALSTIGADSRKSTSACRVIFRGFKT